MIRLDTQQREQIEVLIKHLRAQLPELLALYRFGSWGGIHERADSDLDLAVLSRQSLPPEVCWEFAQQLAALAKRQVDLVDLRRASTVMRAQVIANGERLFCADSRVCDEFEDGVFSAYARLNEERRAILQDIQERGSVYGG